MDTLENPLTSASTRVQLVPLPLVPTTVLYEIAQLSGAASTWRTRGRTMSVEAFGQLMADTGEAAFAISDTGRGGTIVGFVGLYNFDAPSMVASMSIFVSS